MYRNDKTGKRGGFFCWLLKAVETYLKDQYDYPTVAFKSTGFCGCNIVRKLFLLNVHLSINVFKAFKPLNDGEVFSFGDEDPGGGEDSSSCNEGDVGAADPEDGCVGAIDLEEGDVGADDLNKGDVGMKERNALMLGMAFFESRGSPVVGQQYRDTVRLESLEKDGYIVYTLDNKHNSHQTKQGRHCNTNFCDARGMEKDFKELEFRHLEYDVIILDYFFSPVSA